jgi:hypothetical protein
MTWQAIFLINPFLALPAIWIALRHVPESYDTEAPPGIDWVGSLLAFGGLGSIAFGLIALPDRDAGDVSLVAYFAVGHRPGRSQGDRATARVKKCSTPENWHSNSAIQ